MLFYEKTLEFWEQPEVSWSAGAKSGRGGERHNCWNVEPKIVRRKERSAEIIKWTPFASCDGITLQIA
jgi:hypothetical protein